LIYLIWSLNYYFLISKL